MKIPRLTKENLKSELVKYINRGNQLRSDFQYISEDVYTAK